MKWFVMEEIPRCHPLMTTLPIMAFTGLREYGIAESVEEAVVDEREGTQLLIFPRERFSKSGKCILGKILEDQNWAIELNKRLVESNSLFFEESEKLFWETLSGKTGAQLAGAYDALVKLQWSAHTAGIPWVIVEFDHQLFTNYLLDFLKERIAAKKAHQSAGEAFSILTTPLEDSFAQKEEKSLLAIAVEIKKDEKALKLFFSPSADIDAELPSVSPEIGTLLENHYREFRWIPYMYEGPAWKKAYFVEVLKGPVKEDPGALLEQAENRHAKTKKTQERLLSDLNVDARHRQLFEIAQRLVFTKGYRKDCLYHFFYCLEPFLKESAKRLGLTLRQVRRFAPWELVAALREGKADADMLNRRWKHHVFYVKAGKGEFFTGDKADEFVRSLDVEKPPADSEAKELTGDCACPGFARGIVRQIEKPEDMPKMNDGDILVAHATNPDIVPAMKKAGAIVTDLGGITCHAAIVSRELKKPCVIGTKFATTWVKDGDVVEVDATHGVVRKL